MEGALANSVYGVIIFILMWVIGRFTPRENLFKALLPFLKVAKITLENTILRIGGKHANKLEGFIMTLLYLGRESFSFLLNGLETNHIKEDLPDND